MTDDMTTLVNSLTAFSKMLDCIIELRAEIASKNAENERLRAALKNARATLTGISDAAAVAYIAAMDAEAGDD